MLNCCYFGSFSGITDVSSVVLDSRNSGGASSPQTPVKKELPQDFNHNQFVPAMRKGHEYEELPGFRLVFINVLLNKCSCNVLSNGDTWIDIELLLLMVCV